MSAPSSTKPDAIVFIPGSSPPWEDSVLDGLTKRMEIAFKRNMPIPLRVHSRITTEILPDPHGPTRIAQLLVTTGRQDEVRGLVDLYSLNLPGLLKSPWMAASIPKKLLVLAVHLRGLIKRVLHVLTNRNKGLRVRLQVILGVLAIVVLVLGFVSLLAGTFTAFVALTPIGRGIRDELLWQWLLPFAGVGLGVIAVVPQRWRSAIDSITATIIAFLNYVVAGEQKDVVVGNLASLVQHLMDSGRYDRIHIVSWSVGALIAVDSLFPTGRPIRRFEGVHTLVTIGCPADLIRMYWPEYFHRRSYLESTPRRWVNIFVPSDLLGSNFIEGDPVAEKPFEVPVHRRLRGRELPGSPRIPGTMIKSSWFGIRLNESSRLVKPDSNVRHAASSTSGPAAFILTHISQMSPVGVS